MPGIFIFCRPGLSSSRGDNNDRSLINKKNKIRGRYDSSCAGNSRTSSSDGSDTSRTGSLYTDDDNDASTINTVRSISRMSTTTMTAECVKSNNFYSNKKNAAAMIFEQESNNENENENENSLLVSRLRRNQQEQEQQHQRQRHQEESSCEWGYFVDTTD